MSYPRFKAFDSNGDPLAGGLLYTYEAGTDTPLALYEDYAFATPHDNPIELDANGEALIYAKAPFKALLKDSDGVTIDGWPLDDLELPPYNSYIILGSTAPATPAADTIALYALGDALVYKDSGGTVNSLISSAGIQAQSYTAADGGGSANAITAEFTPTITALTDKLRLTVISTAANTGAVTFSPDSLTAKAVVDTSGSALSAGKIAAADIPLDLEYSLGLDSWVLIDPAQFDRRTAQTVYTLKGTKVDLTTPLPYDNTAPPQITEGDEVMTRTITPTNASNLLKIEVVAHVAAAAAQANITVALFVGATANALAAMTETTAGNPYVHCISFTHWMVAGVTTELTFRVRAGEDGTDNGTFNGVGGNQMLGGVAASSITITEYNV